MIVREVVFLGRRDDVPALLCAADVFVLSSDYEGWPLVVGETMACECSLVATDCGGVREIVGDMGYLVPPRNHGALAKAILEVLELDSVVRADLKKNARRRIVENYSVDIMFKKYMAVYEGSLNL